MVTAVEGNQGEITKLEKKEETEQPAAPLRPHLAPAPRQHMYGFSARRTLSAAQRLYEEHKALTYPRTNSRFLTGDMVAEIKPTAELVGHNPQYTKGAEYVLGLDELPLAARGQRQEGAGPPRDHPHALRARPGQDGAGRAEGLRPGGQALPRRSSTPRPSSSARAWRRPSWSTCSARAAAAWWRPAGRPSTASEAEPGGRRRTTRAATSSCRSSSRARPWTRARSSRCARRPSRRAGTRTPRCSGRWRRPARRSEDAELREAMKDSGIGTPATRAAIIERLVTVGYLEREGRSLRGHREGDPGGAPARRAPAHLARAHRQLGAAAAADRAGRGHPARVHEATSPRSPPRRCRSWTS